MTEKQRKIRMIISWACILLWGILAVILSRQDGNTTSEISYGISDRLEVLLSYMGINIRAERINEIIRKAAHIVIYLVLGGLLYYALAYTFRQRSKQSLILAITLCLSASSLDELQKLFIPGRHCDPGEMFLNSIAGIVGIGFNYFFYKHKTKTNKRG